MSTSQSSSSCVINSPSGLPFTATEEPEIVGGSAAMRRVRLQVRRIGPHFRTVLVSGEAGTGKKLVARALHAGSHAASGPFVVCPAAAFEQGLASAQQGTLFLDGVDQLSLAEHSRLLAMLKRHEIAQSREGVRRTADIRIVASTTEHQRILVSTGRFRPELYQRLATLEIALPPLRERMEDLPELARYLLSRFELPYGQMVQEIADGALARMQRNTWPGNVRELENVLRDGVMQCAGEVLESHHLAAFAGVNEPKQPTAAPHRSVKLHDVVEQHVLSVLKDCGGNKLRAAEALGISRSTLYRMLDAGPSADILL
jgi:DNA-binding NtrC family response regulator